MRKPKPSAQALRRAVTSSHDVTLSDVELQTYRRRLALVSHHEDMLAAFRSYLRACEIGIRDKYHLHTRFQIDLQTGRVLAAPEKEASRER